MSVLRATHESNTVVLRSTSQVNDKGSDDQNDNEEDLHRREPELALAVPADSKEVLLSVRNELNAQYSQPQR